MNIFQCCNIPLQATCFIIFLLLVQFSIGSMIWHINWNIQVNQNQLGDLLVILNKTLSLQTSLTQDTVLVRVLLQKTAKYFCIKDNFSKFHEVGSPYDQENVESFISLPIRSVSYDCTWKYSRPLSWSLWILSRNVVTTQIFSTDSHLRNGFFIQPALSAQNHYYLLLLYYLYICHYYLS